MSLNPVSAHSYRNKASTQVKHSSNYAQMNSVFSLKKLKVGQRKRTERQHLQKY